MYQFKNIRKKETTTIVQGPELNKDKVEVIYNGLCEMIQPYGIVITGYTLSDHQNLYFHIHHCNKREIPDETKLRLLNDMGLNLIRTDFGYYCVRYVKHGLWVSYSEMTNVMRFFETHKIR